jgi:hypothetical protein
MRNNYNAITTYYTILVLRLFWYYVPIDASSSLYENEHTFISNNEKNQTTPQFNLRSNLAEETNLNGKKNNTTLSVITSRNLATSYSIDLELVGIPTEDLVVFQNAAIGWGNIITQDLPDVPSNDVYYNPPSGCTYPTIIDDLYICGKYGKIDGRGGVLGYSSVR